MQLKRTAIEGLIEVEVTLHEDERGVFARTYDEEIFARAGLPTHWPQCNTSFNRKRGTLRGMHFQKAPHAQAKLIRTTRGALVDVIVDLREDSPTYRQWDAVELTADNHRMLYMPEGIAHGYLTLEDNTEAYYHVSAPWVPAAESGVRWDDPAFAIQWPFDPAIISDKDRAWPLM